MSFLPDVVNCADDLQLELLCLEIGHRLRASDMMLLEPLEQSVGIVVGLG